MHQFFFHLLFFRFPVFTAKKQLSAIDWNYHKDLPVNESNTHPGKVTVSRKYNQRTKSRDSKVIKKAKRLYICHLDGGKNT